MISVISDFSDFRMRQIYGLGRSRHGGKGAISGLHLNEYTMCIHTLVGGGWPTMQVLVVEIYEEDDTIG